MAELENYWTGKRIIVTGGSGFLGSYLCPLLTNTDAEVLVVPRSYDLAEPLECDAVFMHKGFAYYDLCIHLAARVGGIGYNSAHAAETYYINTMVNTNVIRACIRAGVRKVVAIGSTCMYPLTATSPFEPKHLFTGPLEPTNHPYGLSKLALLTYVQAAQQQYGLQYLFPILCNLYGPSNEADRQNSHVIPAMILKCLDAKYGKSKEITVWGSGSPTREFLFVADAASAIMTAISQGGTGIYNVGSKEVKTISKLVEIIAELTGCSGIPIKYDKLKPDGQMNRLLHSSQFMNAFNWQPLVSMADGLKQTIASIEGKYGGNS